MFDHSSYQIPNRPDETLMTAETELDLHAGSPDLLSLDAARALRDTAAAFREKERQDELAEPRQIGKLLREWRKEKLEAA